MRGHWRSERGEGGDSGNRKRGGTKKKKRVSNENKMKSMEKVWLRLISRERGGCRRHR